MSINRNDLFSIAIILLIPLLVALPALTGLLHSNPMLTVGGLGINTGHSVIPGWPYLDPNAGFTTQALGKLSASLWLHGHVPWWNYYTGVGMPLAAEFQPASFSPANILLFFSNGIILRHLLMQYVAGIGTFFFLRQIGLSRMAALVGGLLFAQNGALAGFGGSQPDPGCFLPWVLLGVEYCATSSHAKAAINRGWILLSLALASMLLAGFPETAFICGLFIGIYTLWRLVKCPNRFMMAVRVFIGLVVGFSLAAPQLLAFKDFLPLAFIGGHADVFGHVGLSSAAIIPTFLAPYAYGLSAGSSNPVVNDVLGNIGGYTDLLLIIVAAVGFAARRDALSWTLLSWIILCTLKIFNYAPVANLFNLIPGMLSIAFYRYATSALDFAIIMLACFGIEALEKTPFKTKLFSFVAAFACFVGLVVGYSKLPSLWAEFSSSPGIHSWVAVSFIWMTVSSISVVAIIYLCRGTNRAQILAVLLVFDATILFTVPTLSMPRRGHVDRAAISFLQNNLGLQRFYTLGPISPNYGAYFQIASINYNYLPIAAKWPNYVTSHLDPLANDVFLISPPDALTALSKNLKNFSNIGVKYVVAPANVVPFANEQPVYKDTILAIFQMPSWAPYISTSNESCTLTIKSRDHITALCPNAAHLIRREMFFPGWKAYVNGHEVSISKASDLFQSINLQEGQNRIQFRYAPPFINVAWIDFWFGVLLILGAFLVRARQEKWL